MTTNNSLKDFLQKQIKKEPSFFPVTEMKVTRTMVVIRKYFDVTNVKLWKIPLIAKRFGLRLIVDNKRNLLLISEIFVRRDYL